MYNKIKLKNNVVFMWENAKSNDKGIRLLLIRS